LYIKYNFMCSSKCKRKRTFIVMNAKFDTYPMRKTIPAQENAGLVADDFFKMLSNRSMRQSLRVCLKSVGGTSSVCCL